MPKSSTTQKDEHGYTPDNYQPLPNKEAIIHFNGKTLLTSESYLDVKAYEHALAFTVAGLMDEDLLKDVRDGIASSLSKGEDFRTFKQRLKPYLMAKGWLAETLDDGTQQLVAGSNRRLRTIYSTNLQSAYSAGQWSRIQQTKEFLPYLQYMPSVSENPRLSHKRYYGLCRKADDQIWTYIMPSNGWGCKCWVKQLTRKQAEKILAEQQKAIDAGEAVPFEMEWDEYTNPKTGEVSKVPKGVDPSFAHNHDRFTALIKLAEDKHGRLFASNLKKEAEKLLPATLPVGVPVASESVAKTTEEVLPTSENTSSLTDEEFMTAMDKDYFNRRIKKIFNENVEIAKQAEEYGLTREELFSIMGYTDGHGRVQDYIRDIEKFDKLYPSHAKMTIRQIDEMISGLQKLPNYEGEVIRRVTNYANFETLRKGDTYTESAFSSSSISDNPKNDTFPKRKIRLIMQSKTGKRIDWLAYYPYQREVLFLPNVKFEITDIQNPKGELWIYMTEIF